jgi:transcriptional antiterminator
MKNPMLPESELKILGEIFQKVDELLENHEKTPLKMSMVEKASDAEQLHIVMYMDMLKEMVVDIKTLKDLLEVSEEDFIKSVTDNGKRTMREVKRVMMMKMITDMM